MSQKRLSQRNAAARIFGAMRPLHALLITGLLLVSFSAEAKMRSPTEGWDVRGNATFAGLLNPPWSVWTSNISSGNFARVTADVETLGNLGR
jgi:hypothetical protein